MSRLLKPPDYLVKRLGIAILCAFISLGAIGGCSENGGGIGMNPGPPPSGKDHKFTFVNNCAEAIWIGGWSNPPSNQIGIPEGPTPLPPPNCTPGDPWKIDTKQSSNGNMCSLMVPFCWTSGQFFARTGCTNTNGKLTCKTGDCANQDNQGSCIGSNRGGTLAEFTMDGGPPQGCQGADNYDVSMVSAFNVLIEVKPEVSAANEQALVEFQLGNLPTGNTNCGTAGACDMSGTPMLPTCPWGKAILENNKFVPSNESEEIASCLPPDQMVANNLQPFTNIANNMRDDFKLRCGCDIPGKGCGDPECDGWYACSPTGCVTEIDPSGSCNIDNCNNARDQICDPYGQCDSALGRTGDLSGKWPEGEDSVSSTEYFENIQQECEFAYSWAFDDAVRNADFSCSQLGGGVAYTITFCPE